MIKDIIWEVDGTLFDTYPAITYAISKSLNETGLPVALNVIGGLARQSLDHCFEVLSQRYPSDPHLLRRLYEEHYAEVPLENQPPFPGVLDVCTFIQEHGGQNVAVTHRSLESTRSLLTTHNLASLFSGIVSVGEEYARKPDPALLEAAIRRFDLDRTTTLAIGDREIDIQAGRAAGLLTCLFGQAELSTPADYRIEDYRKLVGMLGFLIGD